MSDWYGETEVAALKVGDEVGVTSGDHYSPPIVARVTKRTATQVSIGNDRFSKRGQAFGGTTWRSRHLISPESARRQIADHTERHALVRAQRALEQRSWRNLTLEQCEAVQALLATFNTIETVAE